MRICAVSFTHKLTAAMLAAVLALALVPADAFATTEGSGESDAEAITSNLSDQSNDSADSVILSEGTEGSSPSVTLSGAAEGGEAEGSDSRLLTLASGLAGAPANFINSDVALDGEPIIGSFTVDGFTYAVVDESTIELVGVSEAAEADTDAGMLTLPETTTYEGVTYTLASIAPYAFYLSGVTDVELPASVNDVDDRAFRSSDVASVTVVEGNPSYSSFDGALYGAEHLSLLLIPEGKQGTVRIPKTAEVAEASVFSHCPLVDAISVDAGSAAFASENGLLYTSDLTTLLRVPAGATEITIREGCTTIAAGALEACAELTTINAPATVTSISPDIFHVIPTVILPAASLAEDAPQLTAVVALSSTDDALLEVDPSAISVFLPEGADYEAWREHSFSAEMQSLSDTQLSAAGFQSANAYGAQIGSVTVNPNGGTLTWWLSTTQGSGSTTSAKAFPLWRNWAILGGSTIHVGANDTNGFWSLSVTRAGYTFAGWEGYALGPTYSGTNSTTFKAMWTANTIHTIWDSNGGYIDGDTGGFNRYTTYSPSATLGTAWDIWGAPRIYRTGYTFTGWYTSKSGGTQVASGDKLPTSDTAYYAHWAPNSYTVQYQNKADTATLSTDTGFKYDTTRKLAAMPSSGVTPGYTAVGWANSKGQSTANYSFEKEVKNLVTSGTKYLYLAERAHTYTVTFDSAGGSPASDISATYDKGITLPTSTRQGYAFGGWKDEGTGTIHQAGDTKNLTTADKATVKLVAQWNPVISADVPQTVTTRVDVLGIEEQAAAASYIESRCGEPLRVTEVGYARLSGATELFGDRASEVRLEAFANGATAPTFSFALKGSGYLVDSAAFMAFDMAGYGARVPISYRFAIPDDLLPQLQETTSAICQVSYTVDLG